MSFSTITEIENWMVENGIKNSFTPGNRFETDEGYGLENYGGIFIWYYFERENRQNLNYFITEKDAVDFLFEFLKTEN